MMRHFMPALLAAVAVAIAVPAFAQEPPIVAAPAGSLRGETVENVHVFRGIPYALPPVSERRWRAPAPMPRWDGVLDAAEFGAACMQPPSPYQSHAALSEDCLFLNIWTPADAHNAPVLFWIHGGSLISGAASEAFYDGARFAERGIIVVSINYRLGALGWLAHPALSAESGQGVSGNYGLMDQIAALRWVRDNISAFGGDPGNVTIAGQSAGALSVTLLLAAPDARGLFHRAIAQSPYLITMPELRDTSFADWPDAETVGITLANHLGAEDLAGLRALSADAIVAGSQAPNYFPLATIDGRMLRRQLVDVWDHGEQAPVPILAGFNEGEIRALRFLLPPPPPDGAAYEREIRARYDDLADAFLARYPAHTMDESMLATTRDAMYGWSAERLAAKQTDIGAPSFLYFFDHGYPAADDRGFHAFHGEEVPFVFGTTQSTPAYFPAVPQTAQEQRLSDAMMNYWANFARTGVPSAEGEAGWRPYGEDRAYMAFEDAPHMRAGPPNGYQLYEAVVCRRRAHGIAWHWNVGVIAPPLPPSPNPRAPCRSAGR